MAKKAKVERTKTKQTKAKQSKTRPTTAAAKQTTTSISGSTALPEPVFHEPTFSEGAFLPDPTGFATTHPNDKDLYKKLGDLLKKDVVPFDRARDAPSTLFTLSEAYGPHGPAVIGIINKNEKIVFHAIGDSGATSAGTKYGHELSVADHVTNDCRGLNVQIVCAGAIEHADTRHTFGLLCSRDKRPGDRTAERSYKLPPCNVDRHRTLQRGSRGLECRKQYHA